MRMNVTNVMQCLNMCHEHTSTSSQIARHDQPYDKHLKWYQEWTVAWMNEDRLSKHRIHMHGKRNVSSRYILVDTVTVTAGPAIHSI